MIIDNVKIINCTNKAILATIIATTLLVYFFYLFNGCLLSGFNKAFRRFPDYNFLNTSTQSTITDDTQIIFGSIVRIVSLTDDDNRNESSFKYRLVNPQNLSARRLPDVLLIGVKKSGTRALLEFVRVHPDVRAAGCEVHFFDRHYTFGLNWYRKKMPPTVTGQLTMEKTPSYFVTSSVPSRVYKMNPKIKLLLVVRNPVTRAISDYTQSFSKNKDMKKFEELSFVNGSYELVDTSYGAIKIGVYAKYLERWLKWFPLKQLLIVSGERLISDPAAELYRVQDFLNLKRVITEKHFYFNSTKGFPCLLKSESRSTPHCLGKTKGRSHPKIDRKAIERLSEFYKPFNQKFYLMTGINFGEDKWTGRWFPTNPNEIQTVDSTTDSWKGKWFPEIPSSHNSNDGSYERDRIMGIPNSECDDGETNLSTDFDPNNYEHSVMFTCLERSYKPNYDIEPIETIYNVPKFYTPVHKCMNETISYEQRIPTLGYHRPLWAAYGEYIYLPPQRWLHNLEHGAIVALYHPCANKNLIDQLKKIVKRCLFRHIITPSRELSPQRPFALVGWGTSLEFSVINRPTLVEFIRKYAKAGPEKVSRDGQYKKLLTESSKIITDVDDSDVCP